MILLRIFCYNLVKFSSCSQGVTSTTPGYWIKEPATTLQESAAVHGPLCPKYVHHSTRLLRDIVSLFVFVARSLPFNPCACVWISKHMSLCMCVFMYMCACVCMDLFPGVTSTLDGYWIKEPSTTLHESAAELGPLCHKYVCHSTRLPRDVVSRFAFVCVCLYA